MTPVRVLIWAKTYPELSKKYRETVCTAGCLEDGTPVRIYPVPLRYLDDIRKYRLYDWVEVPLRANPEDSRPESFRIAKGSEPTVVSHLGTDDGWRGRREVLCRRRDWHFGCATLLHHAQQQRGTSLGWVKVREVVRIEVVERPTQERVEHEARMAARKQRIDMFAGKGGDLDLEFIPWRFRVHWRCENIDCREPHSASVLDWGLNELARRQGRNVAERRLTELWDPTKHDLGLFLGNLNSRRHIFSIVSLWYPLLARRKQGDLFTP